jgi:hypothetical protein
MFYFFLGGAGALEYQNCSIITIKCVKSYIDIYTIFNFLFFWEGWLQNVNLDVRWLVLYAAITEQ